MIDRNITNPQDLTPIDVIKGVAGFDKIHFKRDDLYLPFKGELSNLGGGKLRTTQLLLKSLEEEIKKYDGIITYSNVNSTQSIITIKSSIDLNYKTHLVFGINSDMDKILDNHKSLSLSKKLGSELYNVTKMGYSSVLNSRSQKLAKEKNLYFFNFSIENINLELIDKLSIQVQNIPDELDALVVPIETGIQLCTILYGIKKYNKNVNRVIGIQTNGYDKSEDINILLKKLNIDDVKYEQIIDKTYPYSKHLEYSICDLENMQNNFKLNKVTDSKALKYIEIHRTDLNLNRDSNILYWVSYNNNFLYK